MGKREMKDEAAALVARKHFRQALELYDRLTRADPLDPFAQLRRADLLQRLQNAKGAAMAYQLAARAFRVHGLEHHAEAALRLSARVAATGTTCLH